MTIVAILVAIVFALLAFKFVKGLVKFGILALIVIAVAYFLMNGAAH